MRIRLLALVAVVTVLFDGPSAAVASSGTAPDFGDLPIPSVHLVGTAAAQQLGRFGVGDLNGDGWPDLVVAGSGGAIYGIAGPIGPGAIPAESVSPLADRLPPSPGTRDRPEIAFFDLTQDGVDDLVVLRARDGFAEASVLLGRAGFFLAATDEERGELTLGLQPMPREDSRLAFGDLNGDGVPDLVYTTADPSDAVRRAIVIAFGPFERVVGQPVLIPAGGHAILRAAESAEFGPAIAIGRFDGSQAADLVVLQRAADEWALVGLRGPFLSGVEQETAAHETFLTIGLGERTASDVAIGDVDADARPDLIVGQSSRNRISIVPAFAVPPPGQVTLARVALEVFDGPRFSATGDRLVAADYDADGIGDLLGSAPDFDRAGAEGTLRNTGLIAGYAGRDRSPSVSRVAPLQLPAGQSTVVTIHGTRLSEAHVFVRAPTGRSQAAVLERALGSLQVLIPVPRATGSLGLEVRVAERTIEWEEAFTVVPAERVVPLRAGWNLVGWSGPTLPVGEATASLAGAFDAVLSWSPERGYDTYRPQSDSVNTLSHLSQGTAVWIHLTRDAAWPQPRQTAAARLPLQAGLNLVTWSGPDGTPVAQAVASVGGALRAVYRWDQRTARYLVFSPDLPGSLTSVGTLDHGDAVWLATTRDVVWAQDSPAAPALVLSAREAGAGMVLVDQGSRRGSGFVVSENLIVTAAHIVRGARIVSVRFTNGATAEAVVVAVDGPLDVALLAVPRLPAGVPRLDWQSARTPEPATPVWAWGFPLGDLFGETTQPTVSMGIVSALQINSRGFPVIQHDAATASGNSGGPLVTADGRVVGVEVSHFTSGGADVEGVNIAADLEANRARIEALLGSVW